MKRLTFGQAALAAMVLFAGGLPATAGSIINSTVQNGQNLQSSAVAGAGITISGTGYLAQSTTDWGVNHVYAHGTALSDNVIANSSWTVQFTLSGGNLGDVVNLAIQYSFHGILGPISGGQSSATMTYCLASVVSQAGCDLINPLDRTTGFQGQGDQCTSYNDPAVGVVNPTFGQCQGTYNYAGTLVTNAFHIGSSNTLTGTVGSNIVAGTVDAFNTASIVSITLPTGISWAYQDGITGNPLNFQNASVGAVPEPGTFAIAGLGLAGLAALRRKR